MNQVKDRLTRIFTDRMNVDLPGPDADLIEEGILDSLALVNLLLHLEQEFGLKPSIETLDFHHFRSMDSIVAFVTQELAPRSAA